MSICFSYAIADDSLSESINHEKQSEDSSETGIEIGVLVTLGSDFRVFHRKSDSPWLFGVRYLDIKDDFMNESAVGLPSDESDKYYTKTSGLYFNYLFNHRYLDDGSYYLSGAIYNTTRKLECDSLSGSSESDSESATSVYFGGGYQGRWGNGLGYKIGLLVSPFVNFELNTSTCSEVDESDIDLNLSLIFAF